MQKSIPLERRMGKRVAKTGFPPAIQWLAGRASPNNPSSSSRERTEVAMVADAGAC